MLERATRRRPALGALTAVPLVMLVAAPAVAAPGWFEPVDVSVATQNADGPQVAVDGRSDAVAVWGSFDGTDWIVQGAVRRAARAWGTSVVLSPADHPAGGPQVAVDARGNAVAVWSRLTHFIFIVVGAVRPAGGTWEPMTVSTQDTINPQVAVDARGNAVAVWVATTRGLGYIVQAAERLAGGAWDSRADLSTDAQSADAPEVAVNPRGDAVAVWERYDGASSIVQSAVGPGRGAWQTPVDLSTAGQHARSPQVAVDASGSAVAIWTRYDGAHWNVQSAVRPPRGAWQAPVDLSSAGQHADGPQVALDARGNAVAVWHATTATITSCGAPSGGRAGRGSVPSTSRLPPSSCTVRRSLSIRAATPSRCGRASPAPTPSSRARTTTPNDRHTTMMGTPRCSAPAATSATPSTSGSHACSKAPPRGVRSLAHSAAVLLVVLMAAQAIAARAAWRVDSRLHGTTCTCRKTLSQWRAPRAATPGLARAICGRSTDD